MSSLRILVTALAVALLSAAPIAAHAAGGSPVTTWHVSPSGDDASGGGPNTPLASVAEAFDRASAGDTILLMDGEHGSARLEAKSGTAQNPITLIGSTGAVVQASPGVPALALNDVENIALVDLHLSAGPAGVELVDASEISIDGLVVSDTNGDAISMSNSAGVVVEDCRVLEAAGDGIRATNSDSLLVDRCEFSGVDGAAVRVSAGDAEIRDNRINDATGGVISNGTKSLAIVTANNISGIGTQPAIRVDGPARIVNNSIGGAAVDGIVLGAGAANSGEGSILHNTVWAVGNSPFRSEAAKPVRVENNLGIKLPGNRSASRSDFVDAAAGDLRLSSESLALDSASKSEVNTDQRGRTRPLGEGPDFGAFESSYSAPTAPTTSVPTETTAAGPNPEDIPTGLGEPGVVEREPSEINSQTDASASEPEAAATNGKVEPDANGSSVGSGIVEDSHGDIALADATGNGERDTIELSSPPVTNPPLSYRTISDEGSPSMAGAIAAAGVVIAGGVGGMAITVSRRRTEQPAAGDPWEQGEQFSA